MMGSSNKFSLDEITFYFDQQRKDAFDQGMLASKATQILNLRDKLLQLSPADFSEAMGSIQKIVNSYQMQKYEDMAEKKRSAYILYDEARHISSGGGVDSTVDKI